ncbi:MAG TPA: SH3 domain-containing protein [Candidatus Omnitrophota bacterium]|nr:SH3 domain-containing protein [Candidatus Omnitrophota bacterium]
MKKNLFLFLVFLSIFSTAWAEEDLPPLPKGPLLLTSATPAMQEPEYWIKRIPNAEKPIKTFEQLKHFNDEIRALINECVDVFKLDRVRPGKQITDTLKLEFDTIRNRKLFGVDDKYIKKDFFDEEIKPLVQIDKVPERIKMKWGVTTRATSVRALPVDVKMLEEKGDVEFDQLQFTLIKLWTPVGIFHKSSDGKWLYVQAPYVRGWVRAKDIALFPEREDIKKYLRAGHFLVVTGESIRVYRDMALQEMIYRPTMGTLIPLVASAQKAEQKSEGISSVKSAGPYTVWMPFRKDDGSVGLMKGYVSRKSDVTKGYPVYSQANLIRQAFKLLGARYGWGGQYNGRDCSGFVHDVFLSLGVDLPRDSKQQALVGTQLGFFQPFQDDAEKKAVLKAARPGITLLKMPHHQMMYLGTVNDQFYVIHSTWAERTGPDKQLDEKRRINQVVVSDLELNGRSYVGSLFDRIISMNEVD